MNEQHKVETVGIVGTSATWALANVNTFLSIAVSLCTLIVVAPKAWAMIRTKFSKTSVDKISS